MEEMKKGARPLAAGSFSFGMIGIMSMLKAAPGISCLKGSALGGVAEVAGALGSSFGGWWRVSAREEARPAEIHRVAIQTLMRFLGCEFRLGWVGGAGLAAWAAFAVGCAPVALTRYEYQRMQMGVESRVTVYAKSEAIAREGAVAAFDRIAELEEHFSDYRPKSELSRLSDRAGEAKNAPWIEVSPEMREILRTSAEISRASGYAFDVALGRSVRLWRGMRKSGVLATKEEVERALATAGEGALEMDGAGRVRLPREGTRLDLGGIAKGYAAQAGVLRLREVGLPICLVSLAGDVCAGESPPGARGWTVLADSEQRGAAAKRLLISNMSASTSGDTFQFVEIGGVRYSHIIDPKTGLGMTVHRSVTTVGMDGAVVDAVAKALIARGREGAMELCTRYRVGAVISEDGGNVEVVDPFGLLHGE